MFNITYDTVASFSQVTSLLMFLAMFIAVVAYAFWPRNGPRFEWAQRRALDLDATTTGFPSPLAPQGPKREKLACAPSAQVRGGVRGGGTPSLGGSAIPPLSPTPTTGEGTRRPARRSLRSVSFFRGGANDRAQA